MDPLSEKLKQEKKIVLQDVHLKNNPMGSDSVIVIPAKVHQKFIPPLIYRVSGTAGNNDADRPSKGTKDKMPTSIRGGKLVRPELGLSCAQRNPLVLSLSGIGRGKINICHNHILGILDFSVLCSISLPFSFLAP